MGGFYFWKRSKRSQGVTEPSDPNPNGTPPQKTEEADVPGKGAPQKDTNPNAIENRTNQSDTHGSDREGDEADTDDQEGYLQMAYNSAARFGNGVLQVVGLDTKAEDDDSTDPEDQTSDEDESSDEGQI